ncbi:hypothetical protein [uncultured Arcobacter sp.]|uniref:hypothetical protein n=1 Tax=uncultured Arcobacter sp. TaxID=165434 RepID=UPI00261AB288|nr:hypothetical protein [uncultured Arcobacter sp.]
MNEIALNPVMTKLILTTLFGGATLFFVKEIFSLSSVISKIDKALVLIKLDHEKGCDNDQKIVYPIYKLKYGNSELFQSYFVDLFIIKSLIAIFIFTLLAIAGIVFQSISISEVDILGTLSVFYIILGVTITSYIKNMENSTLLYQHNENIKNYKIVYLTKHPLL